MRVRWHSKVSIALAVALLCLAFRVLTAGQGYFTAKIWELDFGFARLKSWTFFVWFGELFHFPFDVVVFFLGLAAVLAALIITVGHFVSQRRVDAEPGASPYGGPAEPSGHSGVAGGPPSVS